MSLQGSLDTFALPDVLLLLAGTKKSGELNVAGHRTATSTPPPEIQGRIWFDEGHLVGSDVPRATDAVEAVFELLRLVEGTFSFETGTPEQPQPPLEVEPVLTEAQTRIVEWREIEQVVPSLGAWLELCGEPPGARVAMRGDQWRLIAAIGGGCEVDAALGRIGLGELAGCRAVKEVVEARLVTLTREEERQAAAGAADWRAETAGGRAQGTDEERPPWPTATTPERGAAPDRAPARVSAERTIAERPAARKAAAAESAVVDVDAAEPGGADLTARADAADWQLEPADDVASLVTFPERLVPSAKPASVASAPVLEADQGDVVEGEAGELGEDGDEPLNRGLLLKFLSSVRN